MDIVEVVWDDAHVTTEEITIKEAMELKPVRTYTVGYLLAENEDGLVLCSDRFEKDKKVGKIVNFIGWGMVVDYEYIVC